MDVYSVENPNAREITTEDLQTKAVDDLKHLEKGSAVENDVDENQNGFKSFSKTLLQSSSIYAISRLGNETGKEAQWIHRCYWLAVLILGLIGGSIQCHSFLLSYFSYPVIVNLDIEDKGFAHFPAITVCNLNRASDKKFAIECFKDDFRFHACKPYYEHFQREAGNLWTDSQSKYAFQNNKAERCDYWLDDLRHVLGYSELPHDFRHTIGLQYHDFIRECRFNGRPCSQDDFSTEYSALDLGNCYTFKGEDGSDVPRTTKSVGMESGLHLILNVDKDRYTKSAKSVGARVIIHELGTPPDHDNDGVNVAPGFEVSIGLKAGLLQRLPPPYKDMCHNYITNPTYNNTYDKCVRACFQKKVISRCNCSTPQESSPDNVRICNLNFEQDLCCLKEIDDHRAEVKEEIPCFCPLPCERNTVKVKIYFKTLETAIYRQMPKYEESELFSQMGGQLGLWLGISIMAVFECLESLILLIHYAIRGK